MHRYQITAEPEVILLCCPHCGGSQLHRHEVKHQLFLDIPIRGKQTGILVLRKRYLCCFCKRTFFEPLKDMNECHAMTKRLVLYLAQASLYRGRGEKAPVIDAGDESPPPREREDREKHVF
jgi:transposase